jgi:hypothetical protein
MSPGVLRSKEDEYVTQLDTGLSSSGFTRFPLTERPFTYRSGKSFSTIDYAFTRNLEVQAFSVARLVFELDICILLGLSSNLNLTALYHNGIVSGQLAR